MPSTSRRTSRRAAGAAGEALAARHVESLGWTILARGWRPPFAPRLGEADLLARDGDTLVLVEVRTVRGRGFGHPLESFGRAKCARLSRLAAAAARHFDTDEVRVDAIGVDASRRPPALTHLRGIL